jgi:hypothetical protein
MSWSVDKFFNMWNAKTNKTSGVSHFGLAIYILKYLKAKEDLWKPKSFNIL